MSEDIRWKQRFSNYIKALGTLTEAVEISETRELSNLEKQGVIKAFEYTHELSWKLLKDYLEDQGIKGMVGSKDAIRQAINKGLLENNHTIWMDMIKERNKSAHTYDIAILHESIVRIIDDYYPELKALSTRFGHYYEEQ